MPATLISLPFPVPFSEWVTTAEFYWSTLAKRPRALGIFQNFAAKDRARYQRFVDAVNADLSKVTQ
jgi:hypothetical protein